MIAEILYCRALTICAYLTTVAISNDAPPYEITTFAQQPGIYFEKVGRMHPVEATWKLVIKTDLTPFTTRLGQIKRCVERTETTCEILLAHSSTCKNLHAIISKGEKRLQQLTDRLKTVYKTPNKRRGLIDGIGVIAKTLFGTMDADDDKLINEQLSLLQESDRATKHALQHQLKVINATIGHISNLEQVIEENENTLKNLMEKVKSTLVTHSRRHDLDEHYTLINAIINDLTRDVTDTLDYITCIKEGKLHPRLIPIETIITNLKNAAINLPQGLYFPFNLRQEEWLDIEKITKITAYCDGPTIFTILRFPLATTPTYELIHVIPLPVHSHDNIFASIELRMDRNRHRKTHLCDT
ncbi:PREDICTED: uncharacterized protein LOC105557648 [Vollenhovia emeryi]|uniref:uncharacterized protein LOC105557648 n=1 Tax=Vollenhovia emeryi TaxID=411798 RepID=UPI0005F583D9|nr:PREDICTED: uncharacterized protein LOC105557648 [Vollenhovia emeryi]